MADYTPARIKREALRAVNRIREADGEVPLTKLPCGVPVDPCKCPISRALTYGDDVTLVTHSLISTPDRTREFKTPAALARFVRAFDSRELPELICE